MPKEDGNGFIGGNARFPLCGTVERTMTKGRERDRKRERRQNLLEEEEELYDFYGGRTHMHAYICHLCIYVIFLIGVLVASLIGKHILPLHRILN